MRHGAIFEIRRVVMMNYQIDLNMNPVPKPDSKGQMILVFARNKYRTPDEDLGKEVETEGEPYAQIFKADDFDNYGLNMKTLTWISMAENESYPLEDDFFRRHPFNSETIFGWAWIRK